MEYALQFAETGHLCLATLHANNANQALDRIINFFPSIKHSQIWLELSLNLNAIIAQLLVPRLDEKGRVAAVEILINTPVIQSCIKKGQVDIIKEYIDKCLWKIETPTTLKQEKAKYEIGDLVYNKISEKVSLINNVLDGEDKDTVLDIQTKQHSRFWYKIQAPGQVQEPLSETIIDYGIENKWFEIHKKK